MAVFEGNPVFGGVWPKATGLPLVKRAMDIGRLHAEVWFSVLGMHSYRVLDGPSTIVRKDFTDFNTTQTVAIQAKDGAKGTIYFLLRITYFLIDRGSGWSGVEISEGLVNYRCSFDYSFGPDKGQGLSAKDLIIEPADISKDPYEEQEMGDDQVVLGSFNAVPSAPGGAKFLRISPSVILPGVSSSSAQSIQVGRNVGEKGRVQGTLQDSSSVSEPQSPSAVGSFTLNIQVVPNAREVIPLPNDLDVFFNIGKSGIDEIPRTKGVGGGKTPRAQIDAWMTQVEAKYPEFWKAIKKGTTGKTGVISVKGYASNNGSRQANDKVASDRAKAVQTRLLSRISEWAIPPQGYGIDRPEYGESSQAVDDPLEQYATISVDQDEARKAVQQLRTAAELP